MDDLFSRSAGPEDRDAVLRALQGLSLEEAVELLLELGVLDSRALAERRDAQERGWRVTSGDELEALRRQARQQRRKAQELAQATASHRRAAMAVREVVVQLDERRRELVERRQGRGASATLEATQRALAAALAAGRVLREPGAGAATGPRPAPPQVDRRLELREHAAHGRYVISPAGEIDVATVDQLSGALSRALRAGALEVWVDLREVSFMDSTAVAALLSTRRELPAGVRLGVVCPSGPCRRVLDLTGVSRLVAVVSALEPAG